MYPYPLFFGITLYEICIVLAIVFAMVAFRVLADKAKFSARLQNMVLLAIPFALFVGYPCAVVFQWFYNGLRDGEFADAVFGAETGSTFYGGLIGGATAFLLFYFIVGHFRTKNKEHLRALPIIFELGPGVIALGHAVGRVGCFFAGCCHGIRTDSPLGVYLETVPYKVLPTQLFEAGFLVMMFIFLTLRFYDGKKYNLPIYLIGYGVWRFLIEFLRGDDRGQTFIKALSPSQLTAIVLILLGIALIFLLPVIRKKCGTDEVPPAEAATEAADETSEETASETGESGKNE